MALPTLTAEQRAEALGKAMAARRERSDLLARLKSGEVAVEDVLNRTDLVARNTLVVRLLRALPGVGTVRTTQLLDELGVSENRRVRGLGPRQRERLLQHFPTRH